MKKINVLEGQMDLFTMQIQESIKSTERINAVIEKAKIEGDHFKDIINLYKNTCSRIVKTVSGALLVELEDKTLYFNKEGKNEFNMGVNFGILPADEIIVANDEKPFNDIQNKKLLEINPEKYIKRKGDLSIIIPTESKNLTITKEGWVIGWEQKPKFKENEIFTLGKTQENKELSIGDTVEFVYKKQNCKGKVVSIYNNNETINVSWDGKLTAFYHTNLKKVIV
ncbi:hypothetical protein [uncultured Clostridium sp.]|uniref:hypothetical protein n=1 Tax=uncultured Clostridium sp. TaxID=59620 RepID=UPI0028E3F15C|nr:hypothetical protein [uncultured Clostridium sp.]